MKVFLILLGNIVIFLILFSCNDKTKGDTHNQVLEMDTVEIISKLKKGEKAYLYFYDHFQDLNMPIEFKDSMKVKIAFKDYLLLKDTEKQIMFPVSTSEKLYVTKDKENTTLLSSDSKKRTAELVFLIPIIKNHQAFFYTGKDLFYQSILKKIDIANVNHSVSSDYIKELNTIVFCHYLNELVSPFFNPNGKDYSPFLIEEIEKKKNTFQNEKYLKYADFRMALVAYERFLLKKANINLQDFEAISNSITLNFKGKIKDFLLFIFLNHPEKMDANFENTLQTFVKNSRSKEYVNYLKEKYLNSPTLIKSELFNENNQSESLTSIFQSYKGKLIYIDFWASWCMPCRKEIPASKKLFEEYKNRSVQMITISMDENRVVWHKAIKTEELSQTANYLLNNNFESSLAKKFKIESIPRYMIIGKDGKVINADAPRPSDPKLKEIFNDLLNDK